MILGSNYRTGEEGSSFILQYDHEINSIDIYNLLEKTNFPNLGFNLLEENDETLKSITKYMNEITLQNMEEYTYHITDEDYINHVISEHEFHCYLLVVGKTGVNLSNYNWDFEEQLQNLFEFEYKTIHPKIKRTIVDFVKW